jgi:hypothetical protein
MVPGIRNVDPGTKFPRLLFLENENLDTGTGRESLIKEVRIVGFLEHVPLCNSSVKLDYGIRIKTMKTRILA